MGVFRAEGEQATRPRDPAGVIQPSAMAAWLRVTYVMAKRELWAYALSPITYVLATLFLLSQGYSFWLLSHSLSARQASLSTLLAYFFGGTFLYWFFLLFLIAMLTMRLFAPSQEGGVRRSPRELLLSTDAPEGALVLGKHIGATLLYCALWAPTVTSLLLLQRYGGQAATLPGVSILCGYLGVFLTGQSALALGLLVSVLAPSQLVSAAASFVTLSLLLLAGLAADVQSATPWLQALLASINPLFHMDELARGIVDSRRVVYHLGTAGLYLFAAAWLLRVRPGNWRGLRRAWLRIALSATICVGVNVVAARHPLRSDLTQAREYRLAPELVDTLRSLPQAVQIIDLSAGRDVGERDELDVRWRETLLRAEHTAKDRLSVLRVDLDRQREHVRLLAERYRVDRDELRQGVIVVHSEAEHRAGDPRTLGDRGLGRSAIIRRDQLADFERSDAQSSTAAAGSEPILMRYHGDGVLEQALRTVTSRRTPSVCFTRGHGESEHDSLTASGGSELTTALLHENLTVRALGSPQELATLTAQDSSTTCDVVVVSGAERPFLPEEVTTLSAFLDHGGRLLVLTGALMDRELSHFLDTGLEDLLLQRGIAVGQAVVLDPPQRLGDSLAFVVEQGYAAHAVTLPLLGRRTLWPLARPVSAQQSRLPGWQAQVLIHTSEQGLAESNLARLRVARSQAVPTDVDAAKTALAAGMQPLAVVSEAQREGRAARVVVLGSSQIAWNDTLVLYNRDLLVSSVKWLADAPIRRAGAAKQPGQVRLVLTSAQQQRLFVFSVVGLPFLVLLLGLGVRWLRHAP